MLHRSDDFKQWQVCQQLQHTPCLKARKEAGGKGAGRQHAQDVVEVLHVFCTSADVTVNASHVEKAQEANRTKFPRVK